MYPVHVQYIQLSVGHVGVEMIHKLLQAAVVYHQRLRFFIKHDVTQLPFITCRSSIRPLAPAVQLTLTSSWGNMGPFASCIVPCGRDSDRPAWYCASVPLKPSVKAIWFSAPPNQHIVLRPSLNYL